VKIRITENQYNQLVGGQRNLQEQTVSGLKCKLLDRTIGKGACKKVNAFIARLQNPTAKDYEYIANMSRTKLKAILKVLPGKEDSGAPTAYPIPLIGNIEKHINSCYGYRTSTGTNRLHGGVDLRTKGLSQYQPLIATCAGIISKANDDGGDCGGYMKIECNNGDAVGYCHLRAVPENLYGLQVPKGFPIGVSGGVGGDPGSGNSGGAHLHYITWSGGEQINPINMMDGGHSIPTSSSQNTTKNKQFCKPDAK